MSLQEHLQRVPLTPEELEEFRNLPPRSISEAEKHASRKVSTHQLQIYNLAHSWFADFNSKEFADDPKLLLNRVSERYEDAHVTRQLPTDAAPIIAMLIWNHIAPLRMIGVLKNIDPNPQGRFL